LANCEILEQFAIRHPQASTSVYELIELVGATMEPSAMPLENPWSGHADGSLARSAALVSVE
jgi:UDP-glucose 4-epimerase